MNKQNNSTSINRAWHHFDANGKVLGRLATEVATVLRGKHKVTFRRHSDSGDIVVVTNANQIVLTGSKETDKQYRHHTGYPGGLRSITVSKLKETRPEDIFIRAVYGMLPKTRQRDEWMKRLKVYPHSEHPHKANVSQKTSTGAKTEAGA